MYYNCKWFSAPVLSRALEQLPIDFVAHLKINMCPSQSRHPSGYRCCFKYFQVDCLSTLAPLENILWMHSLKIQCNFKCIEFSLNRGMPYHFTDVTLNKCGILWIKFVMHFISQSFGCLWFHLFPFLIRYAYQGSGYLLIRSCCYWSNLLCPGLMQWETLLLYSTSQLQCPKFNP